MLNGQGAAQVNRALRQKISEAFNVTASMLADDAMPEFEQFSMPDKIQPYGRQDIKNLLQKFYTSVANSTTDKG